MKKEILKQRSAKDGITLIALVVTLVVLLILAGITIVYVFGENGVFEQASKAKIENELGKIEEQASTIYSDKFIDAQTGKIEKIDIGTIVDELKNKGNEIEIRDIGEGSITGISLEPATVTMDQSQTTTVKVKIERSEDGNLYYAVVEGKYYEMHFTGEKLTIDREATTSVESTEEPKNIEIKTGYDTTIVTNTEINQSEKTIQLASGTTYGETTITVKYGSKIASCIVKVKKMIMVTKLEINSERARIAKDYTRWLTATVEPNNADNKEVEWSSSDTSVATVDEKGVITAKKAGNATITVRTKDGSNLNKICEVTIVENAPDVAELTDFQTKNIIAKDQNGNLITIPKDFKVLTSEGTKVTDGVVIKGKDDNEFVWVPINSISKGSNTLAEDVRLGRYTFAMEYDSTNSKWTGGKETLQQDAAKNLGVIYVNTYYGEWTRPNGGHVPAKDLGDFIEKTIKSGGYYFARYKASKGNDGKVQSQFGKEIWDERKVANASLEAQKLSNDYMESDLMNSFSWDTAIVFIQKFSQCSNYSIESSKEYFTTTGGVNDVKNNIYNMASAYNPEWTTEHCRMTNSNGKLVPCTVRATHYVRRKVFRTS